MDQQENRISGHKFKLKDPDQESKEYWGLWYEGTSRKYGRP